MPNDFEIIAIQIAKKLPIISISFIDHFINIIDRFIKNNEIFLPDILYVIDQKVKKIISNELNIDNEKIKVIKNPYIKYLKRKSFQFNKEKFKNNFQLLPNKKIICFFPEPLLQMNQCIKYGFSEIDILDDLINILDFNNYSLVVKLHPNHDINLFNKYLNNQNVLILKDVNINELIYCSDFIFGIFSNAILESTALNVATYQLLYKLKNINLNPFKDIQYIKKINTINEISNLLKIKT